MPRGLGTVAVILLLAVAIATNPDEESFRIYIEKLLKKSGSSWLSRKLLSNLTTVMYHRKDYKFWSTIRVPEERTVFLGIFAHWIALPMWGSRKIDEF
ncbi:hypothetical protein DFS34DRAFT_651534 [Phlyctochytrium arcticum]|nr:hypothetical protein DFS34DRAFT_651534 [Phlyctochytrium arcticum]